MMPPSQKTYLPAYDQLIYTIGRHTNLGPESHYIVWNINKGKGQGFSQNLLYLMEGTKANGYKSSFILFERHGVSSQCHLLTKFKPCLEAVFLLHWSQMWPNPDCSNNSKTSLHISTLIHWDYHSIILFCHLFIYSV